MTELIQIESMHLHIKAKKAFQKIGKFWSCWFYHWDFFLSIATN